MEWMQLRKDSFISKPTCYITLCSTQTLSYRLVTHSRAAAYTKNNILSAFEATGIWPRNPCKVFILQSRHITQFEFPPAVEIVILLKLNCILSKRSTKSKYMGVQVRLNTISLYQSQQSALAIRGITVSGHTQYLRLRPYETSLLRPFKTSLLRPSKTSPSPAIRDSSPAETSICNTPPSCYASCSKNNKQTNDVHSSLLKTLHGKWAGKEYYCSLRTAIHINKEICTTSNWPPMDS